MPETRIERILAVTALAAAAVLAVLTVSAWRDYRADTSESDSSFSAPVPQPTTSLGAVAATTAGERQRPAAVGATGGSGAAAGASGASAASGAASPASATTELVIRATRGESWLAVHDGSETGKRLYEGILARGDSERFVRKRLWVRFGFPSNLTATVNGKPATLPSGTATVVVQDRKLRTVAVG